MKRIYHPYHLWEDWKAGFYKNKIKDQELIISKCVQLLSNEVEFKKAVERVINEWPYSCDNNLSNPSLNKVAYIGQAACCITFGAPSFLTKLAWVFVSEESKIQADKIAMNAVETWIYERENKKVH